MDLQENINEGMKSELKAESARASKQYSDFVKKRRKSAVLLQCLFSRLISIFPQCGRMVFPGLVIMQSVM